MYSDRGVGVRVCSTYCQSYCDLRGYSDRGVWVEYAYVPRIARVTLTYVDALTEG